MYSVEQAFLQVEKEHAAAEATIEAVQSSVTDLKKAIAGFPLKTVGCSAEQEPCGHAAPRDMDKAITFCGNGEVLICLEFLTHIHFLAPIGHGFICFL